MADIIIIIIIIMACYYISLKNILFVRCSRRITGDGEAGGGGELRPPRAAKCIERCQFCALNF
jgi:hypothetical protein